MTEDPGPIDLTRLAPRPGSRVLVAGGCGDIGGALVTACLAADLRVAVLDRGPAHAVNPPPDGAIALVADATEEVQLDAAFAELATHWDGLDALVNLIGVIRVPKMDISEYDQAEWDASIAVNLRAVHLVARAALPLLRRAGGGAIVNTSSVLGFDVRAEYGPYGAAKAGVVGLTKALAAENMPSIRANCVAPSGVFTAFMGGGTGRGGERRKFEVTDPVAAGKRNPMGRLGTIDEVVGPILFLISDAARYITGQVLHVNGGRFTP